MTCFIQCRPQPPYNVTLVWCLVILLVLVVGLLSQSPPERPYHSFYENNQKVQYITIGGASTQKQTNNG